MFSVLLYKFAQIHQKEGTDQADSSGDWNLIPESMLSNMVNVHNQFFGSNNLVESVCSLVLCPVMGFLCVYFLPSSFLLHLILLDICGVAMMFKLLIVLMATNFVHFVQPGVIQVSDAAKLHSFVKSYNLGANIVKG